MSRITTSMLAMAALLACSAQQPAPRSPLSLKGRVFLHWGYNRAGFSWSDIHFHGADYDFTLRHVQAADRPEPLSASGYFSPSTIWIPQYNYRAGYFLNDQWSISLGLDHMKYVMRPGQVVRMDGYVASSRSATYTSDEGSRDVKLTDDFLRYEHTDGLNYLGVDADHYDRLWTSKNGRHALHAFEGLGAGPVIPRTDVRLFGEGINNRFHVSGFGLNAQAGLHFTLFRSLFIRGAVKAGWIDLTDVLTTGEEADRASQHFWFWQGQVVLGGTIRLARAQ